MGSKSIKQDLKTATSWKSMGLLWQRTIAWVLEKNELVKIKGDKIKWKV